MECCTRDLVQVNVRQRLDKPIAATEYCVVHLLPGRFLDEIQCVLETRSFQVKTCYEALSYQWGDEPNTKPIHIAHFDSSSQPTLGILTRALPEGATVSLGRASRVLQAAVKRCIVPLWILAWFLGTGIVWRLLLPFPIEPPRWVVSFIPRNVYITLLCILCGGGCLEFLTKAFRIMIEVAETKPWLLAYDFSISRSGKQGGGRSLDFETLQVTTNLALALRHLRQEGHARTLWIDALCINQENEDEKMEQIQRMDWIYANASPIVVWLGGYHGLGEADICAGSSSQEGVDCEHRLQVQAAFDHIWALSGWRLLFGWYFSRDEEKRFRESRSGLCEIARRGWWKRLWVIQEVALATGRVQIQCGHNTCDFEEFDSAQRSIILKYPEDKALTDDFRPLEHFLTTIRDFRYSSFHDREGLFSKTLVRVMMRTMGVLSRDVSYDVVRFQEQLFAQRLHRVLLKTADWFKCRDDPDRLHAVLGIAGGATKGKATKLANFVETISSAPTRTIITKQMDLLWGTSSHPVKVAGIVFALMYSSWGVFYDSKARHWTINRPDYVVAEYRKVIDAVTGGPGARPSRVEVFTALARYLARETRSVAFLDVASCGEDEDEGMPSWVPNWSRKVSKPAYDFASRVKKDQAPDIFGFTEGGKTLQLAGRSMGTVNIMRPADLDLLQSSPWQGAFEKVLVLPSEGKRVVAFALQTIRVIMYQRPFSVLSEAEKELISLSFSSIRACLESRSAPLRAGSTTMVYSYDAVACQIGFLRAGEAVKGDRLVFVPGCFHHLVLRRRGQTRENSIRWKLVGLVAMATATTQRRGCSKSEWAQMLKDGAVHKYTIE